MENAQNALDYKFGLLGKQIDYSFSRGYFTQKFKEEKLPHTYVNFDVPKVEDILPIIKNTTNFKGFNVTIPYKEAIIPLLDVVDKKAKAIGAVNTVRLSKSGQLIGYNTDVIGFKKSLQQHLKSNHKRALILGTGGASKAVAYALQSLNLQYDFVSRNLSTDVKFLYTDLTTDIINSYKVIINCTPLGTFPNVNACPDIPYEGIESSHICYDLIYNPEQTKFLSCADIQGATTVNGLEMLHIQANEAWKIWMME